MTILFFSDIHGDWNALRGLLAREADLYFSLGDLAHGSRDLARAGEILSSRAGRVCLIPGNHETADETEALALQFGLESKHGHSWLWQSCRFAALGYSNQTPFHTPGEYSEEELSAKLQAFSNPPPDVLICHCPPARTPLDQAGPGQHFGSRAVGEAIDTLKPAWFFCGHIHQAEGIQTSLGAWAQTQGVNVGKRGFLLDTAAIRTA